MIEPREGAVSPFLIIASSLALELNPVEAIAKVMLVIAMASGKK